MKNRVSTFFAGMLTMALVAGLGISALAATGQLTLTVDPVNIQVNGATFQPKDAAGQTVPVFAYNGTTYAPLRALAEAYGLQVGYDAAANMATVGDAAPVKAPDTTAKPDYSAWSKETEAAYQEFKGLWEVKVLKTLADTDGVMYAVQYKGALSDDDLMLKLKTREYGSYVDRLAFETYPGHGGIWMSFFGAGESIGTITIVNGEITQRAFKPYVL